MEEMTLEGLPGLHHSCQLAQRLAREAATEMRTDYLVCTCPVGPGGQERSAKWLPHAALLSCLTPSTSPQGPLGF